MKLNTERTPEQIAEQKMSSMEDSSKLIYRLITTNASSPQDIDTIQRNLDHLNIALQPSRTVGLSTSRISAIQEIIVQGKTYIAGITT
jgi:hypothetical protein